MKYTASIVAVAGMAATVRGHGFITSPQARMPGTAMESACGQQVYYNQEGDNYGNIQGELQVASTQTDYNAEKCNIWLCKGYKYADNTENVQSYTAGETVDIKFDVRAPHTGVANVSIVDTSTNTVIGDPLISWDVFASNSVSIPANETSFSITIPSDLGDKCSTAGACVIQHYWNAASIDQTYESCIDFTVGGSGSSGSSSSSAAPSAASTSSAASVTSQSATVDTSSAQSVTSSSSIEMTTSSSVIASSSAVVASSTAVSSSTVASSTAVSSSTVASSAAVSSTAIAVYASSSACSAEKETVTATVTETVTNFQTVTADASSSGLATQIHLVSPAASAASASSSPCTTTLTISKNSASSGFYPYPNSTFVAPSGTVASIGFAASTGFAIPTGFAVPTGAAPPAAAQALTSVLGDIGTAVPSSVLTQTIGTSVPSPTGTSSPSKPLPNGFTLKDVLDWVAYLLSKTIIDAEEEVASSQPSRRHARDVRRTV